MTSSCAPAVTFLNHSSVLVSDGRTRILCDPWFEGAAFQNGWRLLHENSHDINALDFDHVWVSHEHPDHFSIPTLKKLQGRRRFIFQATKDRKVAQWLARQHEVTEIADRQAQRFGDIEARLFVCDGYDSALRLRFADGRTFLNLNDARVELGGVLDAVRADAAYADLVALQFSYANYAGNRGDTQIPRDQHEAVLERVLGVAEALQPHALLLFASYVYFSHTENFYWNQHFWLQQMVDALQARGGMAAAASSSVWSSRSSARLPLAAASLAWRCCARSSRRSASSRRPCRRSRLPRLVRALSASGSPTRAWRYACSAPAASLACSRSRPRL